MQINPVVSDIPMLVQDSTISANIMQQSGAFYTSPHDRNALGRWENYYSCS